MKICTRCHIEKEDSEFRIKSEKYKDKVYTMLNPTCRQCDKEKSKIYYDKHKNDDNFKEKNRNRVLKYMEQNYDKIKVKKHTAEFRKKHAILNMKSYIRMKDVVAAKMKVKRQTPEYKEKMRKYRLKNKDKISKQEVVTKKRFHENNRDNLTDRYAINLLRTQGFGTSEEIGKNKELITLKKAQVLRKRIRLEILKKEKHGKKND